MINEIKNSNTISDINSILKKYAGDYDLYMPNLVKEGINVGCTKGIIKTSTQGRNGTIKEYTGKDVYRIETNIDISNTKDIVIDNIKYR